jgi:hypothetical protein
MPGTPRPAAHRGSPRRAARPQRTPPAPPAEPGGTPDGPDGAVSTDTPPSGPEPSQPRQAWPSTFGRAGDDAASVILGLLIWGWVVRPYLAGGTAGIKHMFRAKFLNQGKDGSQLP